MNPHPKKLPAFLLTFFIITSLFATTDFSFSVTPHAGFTFAQADEILYDSNGQQCSLLKWTQKPIFDAGLTTDFRINNFLISAGFEYSFLAGPSKMTDIDWNSGQKYSETVHPLISAKNIDASLKLACNIKATHSRFTLQPETQVEYMYMYFDADKGEGVRNDKNIKVYGVELTRHSFFLFTGLKGILETGNSFNLTADLLLAPYSYHYETDFHKGVNHPFTSVEIQNGFFSKWKAGFTAGIKLSNSFSIDLYTQLLFGTRDKGTFYSNYYTEKITKFEDQQSGSNIFAVKCGLSTTYLIF